MLARQSMIDTIRRVYELYGFVPLSTPAIEFLDVLSGSAGQEAQQSIFRVTNPENEALGLRFDLTVPLARVIAQYKELPRPFRRYQVSPVWRADKPDKGRFREFTQFDLDSVGTESEVADTEIIAGMCDTLSALNVGRYLVRFSSRAMLNLLLDFAGIGAEQGVDVFRVLDKLDKVGLDKVSRELMNGYKDESGDTIRGVGLSADQVDRIKRFLDIKSDSRREVVDAASASSSPASITPPRRSTSSSESPIISTPSATATIASRSISPSPAASPTTPARSSKRSCSTRRSSAPSSAAAVTTIWSCASSAKRFPPSAHRSASIASSPRSPTSAASIREKRPRACWSRTWIKSLTDDYLQMTWELRRAGIPTEFYIGTAKRLGKQLEYADQYDIPLAILCGSNEKAQGIVTVKNMAAGRAKAVAARRPQRVARRAARDRRRFRASGWWRGFVICSQRSNHHRR